MNQTSGGSARVTDRAMAQKTYFYDCQRIKEKLAVRVRVSRQERRHAKPAKPKTHCRQTRSQASESSPGKISRHAACHRPCLAFTHTHLPPSCALSRTPTHKRTSRLWLYISPKIRLHIICNNLKWWHRVRTTRGSSPHALPKSASSNLDKTSDTTQLG